MKNWTWLLALALLPGCGDDGSGDDSGEEEAQLPPTNGAEMRTWLAAGHYKSWSCEGAAHGPITISPHGMQRICSNDMISGHGTGEYPVGAAAVKELYDADGKNIVGYAVYRHIKAGTNGDAWYWYEQVPDSSMAPHDADGIVADQIGTMGDKPGKDLCVGCHMATGLDANHPGHDFVYTQID